MTTATMYLLQLMTLSQERNWVIITKGYKQGIQPLNQ